MGSIRNENRYNLEIPKRRKVVLKNHHGEINDRKSLGYTFKHAKSLKKKIEKLKFCSSENSFIKHVLKYSDAMILKHCDEIYNSLLPARTF